MEILARYFCLDTVMIDVVLKVVALPQRGGDAVSSQSAVTPGGGFNSMSAAARHGMPSVYAGRVGSGPFSELAIEALGREGIDIPFDADPESDIGICVVIVDEQGERTFVTEPGAEWNLRASDLDGLSIAAGDYVFLSEIDLGFCVVIVDEQGERTFVTAPGAEWNLRASDLDRLSIAAGDYVFLS